MKKYSKLIYVLATALLFGCDYLDKTPDDDLTKDEVFTNPDWARQWLWNSYSWLPIEANFADDGAYRSPFTGGCDEMEIAFGGAYSHEINSGAWNATNVNRSPHWYQNYCAIRTLNVFLENIDRTPNLKEEDYKSLVGEAYFLRAFYHFMNFRVYGPIPIVDRVIKPDEDWSLIVRKDIDFCVNAMVQDCNDAIALLPPTRPQTEYGRPVRAAALALKSRLLLYAASPLYNGSTEFSQLLDPISGKPLFPTEYDAEKWKDAADAALEALNSLNEAGLKLHYSASGDPVKNYEEIFVDNWNDEIIWALNCGEYWHHIWCSDPISYGCPSIFNPTQELVDAYQMANGLDPILGYDANGKPIINAESGYVEDGNTSVASDKGYWPSGVRNMYTNREPRFYASINFAGQVWKHGHALELWYNGVDGKKYGSSDYCKTGYLMRKHNNINITSNPWSVTKTTYNFFRTGELYLNYAEALNEYAGPVDEVYAAVNAIRERAGLPELTEGLSKEEMRERIKHERRIELVFESHRFFDVRRWMDAVETDNRPIHCLNIYEGTSISDNRFYERVVCENRVFESPKHYFFPLLQSEVDKNPENMVQNLGW